MSMLGYHFIQKIKNLEQDLDFLGLMMCFPRHGLHSEKDDMVAIKPKDLESFPMYSREAEFFIGTIDELEKWILGFKWAREYDGMLFGNNHNEDRFRKEQDLRNINLISTIKENKLVQGNLNPNLNILNPEDC